LDVGSENVASNARDPIRIPHSAFRILPLLLVLFLALSLHAASPAPAAFEQDLSWGDVDIQLRAEPAEVRPDRDLMLTLTVTTPSHLMAVLPDLRGRFGGFSTAEDFARDPVVAGDKARREYRWRLTPELAREYRLAPFAVEVRDTRRQPPVVTWFATRPVIFPTAPPPKPAAGDLEVDAKPVWIRPTPLAILTWVGVTLLGVAAFAVLIWGLLRLKRHVREARLSPRERAFAELDRLLHRGLIEKGLYKDFYIELTMVVRRYIERTHGIRAPEQTTEEFLAAATRHPRFTPPVLASLRTFLESSDLVKFAGQQATPQLAAGAVDTARGYVETDSAAGNTTPSLSTLSSTLSSTSSSTSSIKKP
jgi:hypothetical protein